MSHAIGVPAATLASRPGEIPHILAERTVLALVRNPFIVPLKFSFQTADKLYLVMPFGLSLYLRCTPVLFIILRSKRRRTIPPSATGGSI